MRANLSPLGSMGLSGFLLVACSGELKTVGLQSEADEAAQ
jgi:hypothetical protein